MELTRAMLLEILSSEEAKPEDRLGERYLTASTLETQVKKEREIIKAEILTFERGKIDVPFLVETALRDVSMTGISCSIPLFNGSRFMTGAQIKTAGSVVDMGILQDALGISRVRWEKALKEATIPRHPSVTLTIARKQ